MRRLLLSLRDNIFAIIVALIVGAVSSGLVSWRTIGQLEVKVEAQSKNIDMLQQEMEERRRENLRTIEALGKLNTDIASSAGKVDTVNEKVDLLIRMIRSKDVWFRFGK